MSDSEYKQAISFLETLERKNLTNKKWDLKNIRRILKKLSNPQEKLKIIHVAGTNGKGSVCAFLESILTEAGYKVGKYTSPHLIDLTERFTINKKVIKKQELSELIKTIKPLIKNESYFETLSAIAFLHFYQKGVDFAIMETGMGGRLDATNVGNPLVNIITNVSIEHTDWLGDNIKSIAKEKAGIIKPNSILVTAAKGEALTTIAKIARNKDTSVKIARPTSLELGLKGDYQKINAGTAIKAVLALKNYNLNISREVIIKGLMKTSWSGRFERRKNVIFDCAHNEAGIKTLVHELKKLKKIEKIKKIVLILSIMSDKKIKEMIKQIDGFADYVFLTKTKSERSSDPKKLAKYFKKTKYKILPDSKKALKQAKKTAKKNDLVVVAGSIYLVGELLK
ncbi:bifunctional folylpolyglutamate synthase/dihydrofolate synthase [Nanoarchaeota archaeon]